MYKSRYNSYLLILSFLLFLAITCIGQETESLPNTSTQQYKHSISTDPLLLLFGSFSAIWEYQSNKNGYIIGSWYSKSTATYPKGIAYPGHITNISAIVAYRRYLWRNLHAEYQLYPGMSRFYDDNSTIKQHSFSLFNEFRIGYKFNIAVFGLPLMLNLQWPVGFTLYESNEPEKFRDIRKQDPIFFIPYPNIYVGYRF
jgi:hypothetical protein